LFEFFFVGVTRDTQDFIIVAGHIAKVKVRGRKQKSAERHSRPLATLHKGVLLYRYARATQYPLKSSLPEVREKIKLIFVNN
jgi:hypothetical protein